MVECFVIISDVLFPSSRFLKQPALKLHLKELLLFGSQHGLFLVHHISHAAIGMIDPVFDHYFPHVQRCLKDRIGIHPRGSIGLTRLQNRCL